MKAGILTIGDELLAGFTVDTNSAWLARELLKRGIIVTRKASVGDRYGEIQAAIEGWDGVLDLIFTTGGLGPTHDDVTKTAFCRYFDSPLCFDEGYWALLQERYRKRRIELPENNRSQAEVPEKAEVLPNSVGTAPGLKFRSESTTFFVLPGVPREMKSIMDEHILPTLGSGEAVPVVTLRTTGIIESALAARLAPLLAGLSSVRAAYLPSYTGVDLRLRVDDAEKGSRRVVQAAAAAVEAELGALVYGRDDDTLESVVGNMLTERGDTLALAESCSGGLTASRITDIPGSSAYFLGGVIAYSNDAKVTRLKVLLDTLKAHGAVSEPVAREMAEGVRAAFGATWGVSTTGISGPTGGTPAKPVGLVFIAVAGPVGTRVEKYRLVPHRLPHKAATAMAALNLLRLEMQRYEG